MKSKTYDSFHKILGGFIRFIFRIKIHGAENEPESGAYLMVSNHISNADPVFLCAATSKQQPHFMAKKELFKIPLLRGLIKALGAFPVDRKGNDVGAVKKAIKMLQDGMCVGMFPQGHRYMHVNPRGTDVKSGAGMLAVKARVQVLPCYVRIKKMRWAPFRRVDVYFGELIKYEELGFEEKKFSEFNAASKYVAEKIVALCPENEK